MPQVGRPDDAYFEVHDSPVGRAVPTIDSILWTTTQRPDGEVQPEPRGRCKNIRAGPVGIHFIASWQAALSLNTRTGRIVLSRHVEHFLELLLLMLQGSGVARDGPGVRVLTAG